MPIILAPNSCSQIGEEKFNVLWNFLHLKCCWPLAQIVCWGEVLCLSLVHNSMYYDFYLIETCVLISIMLQLVSGDYTACMILYITVLFECLFSIKHACLRLILILQVDAFQISKHHLIWVWAEDNMRNKIHVINVITMVRYSIL